MVYSPEELVRIYRSKNSSLELTQTNMLPIWYDIRNFLAPRTARFKGEQVNQTGRQDLNIINSQPRFAVRTLAAGLQSGVTSPMRPWFRLGVPDPDMNEIEDVKEWLYVVERRMRDVLARSNIYDRLKSNYMILGAYGTSCLTIDEDDISVVRANDLPMGSFKIATSDAGRVNTLYRDIHFTCEQYVSKFAGEVGFKNLPGSVQNCYDRGDYNTLYPVCHIIEPNRNFVIGSALSKNKPIASVYLDPSNSVGQNGILSYKGYDENPFMAPRWDVLGEDVYGYGCGEMAIGDGKQTQLMEKRKLQGIDKNVHPTMVADASMRNQRTSSLPGDTVYVNGLITGNQGYRPAYMPNPYINELREEISNTNGRIDEAFYKNLFLMISEIADQPNITATQINTMREEKLLMLGPVLERLNEELLDPIISRVFAIMWKRGLIPPPPKEIQGMPIKIEYVSVLAQAQKAMGIGNIERFSGFVGGLATQKQDPGVWDNVNTDEMINEYGDGVALPPRLINSSDQVAAIRQQRAAQMKAQQNQAMMANGANMAKTLSQADMSGKNALTQMAGVAGAQQQQQ